MFLESQGLPTVVVGTTEFETLAHMVATNRGLPELPIVLTGHPLGGIKEPEVRAKAAGMVDDVARALVPEAVRVAPSA